MLDQHWPNVSDPWSKLYNKLPTLAQCQLNWVNVGPM